MKLIELVKFFRHGGTFEDFCREHALDEKAEVIEIYARTPVRLESTLGFFPVEETEGKADFTFQGIRYQTLFDFFYFLGAIEEAERQESLADAELAERLLSYALKDA